MRRGVCPKCGAASVRHAVNGIAMGDAAYTAVRPHLPPGFRGAVRLHQGGVDAFACTACGYLELWAADPGTLAYISEQWEPVPASSLPPPPPS